MAAWFDLPPAKSDVSGTRVIIDGSHRRWCYATLLLFMLSSGGYVVYARSAPGGARGASVPGMLYGIAGSALMLYAGLIAARKKVPTWRLGSAQAWLRGHIWLGLLSVPLILFHAGFRWGGLLEQILLLVLAAIVASGLIGLLLQQFLPRQMTARVALETFYAQLPYECRLLVVEGDVAVAALCGPLPVAPDAEVANPIRLKALGVTEKKEIDKKPKEKDEKSAAEKEHEKHQKLLASVYRSSGAEVEPPLTTPVAATPPPAENTVGPAAAKSDADEPEQKKSLTAADKIATMRALKRVTPSDAHPLPSPNVEAQSEAVATTKPLTAAEKIALMRGAKAGKDSPATTIAAPKEAPTLDAPSHDDTKKALSAADKIALMRAAKAAKPASAAQSITREENEPPVAAPSGKLSAADKIAMMRAAKAKAGAASTPAAAEDEPPAVAAPSGKLSAADKIAMMRAGKGKTAAMTAAAPETGGAAVSPPAAAETKPVPPPKPVRPTSPPQKQPDVQAQRRGAEELARFYVESVRPFLAYGAPNRGVLASDVNAGGVFAAVRAGLSDDLHPALDQLAALCEKRRQLRVQERMHRWLHGWLFIHVPLSLALLGLGILHAVLSLYY